MRSFLAVIVFSGMLVSSNSGIAASEEAVERNNVGKKLLTENNIEASIGEFQKAAELDPNYVTARLNLAYAYDRSNRVEEAINEYRKSIELQPDSFFAHNNLGVLYDKKGLYVQAIAEFESALGSEPSNSLALKNLENAKKNNAIIQEREAQIARAEKEAQANPSDAKPMYQLARLYAFYGKKELAIEWLGKAVQQGFRDLASAKTDPAFTNLRDDRDFELLLLKK